VYSCSAAAAHTVQGLCRLVCCPVESMLDLPYPSTLVVGCAVTCHGAFLCFLLSCRSAATFARISFVTRKTLYVTTGMIIERLYHAYTLSVYYACLARTTVDVGKRLSRPLLLKSYCLSTALPGCTDMKCLARRLKQNYVPLGWPLGVLEVLELNHPSE
jgi:hypothetical protein